MKRRDLDKKLKQIAKTAGATIEGPISGANHDKFYIAGKLVTVPRHNEINERTAKTIIEQAQDAIK